MAGHSLVKVLTDDPTSCMWRLGLDVKDARKSAMPYLHSSGCSWLLANV